MESSAPKNGGTTASLRGSENYVSSHKGVHLFKLNNGLHVAYDFSAQGKRVEMRLVCPAGSAFELLDEEKGLRHLGEHMYFATCMNIWAKSAGADLNAQTSRNFLIVTVTCDVNKTMDMMKFMKECLAGEHMRSMTQDDVDREKINVNSEGSMNSNHPVRIAVAELDRKLVHAGSADPTIGYSATIEHAKKDAVINLFNKTTGPRNCTMIMVGPPAAGYSVQGFVDETNALFSTVPNNPDLLPVQNYRKRDHAGMQMVNVRRNVGGTLVAMGWPSPSAGKESMVLRAIETMLTMDDGILEPLKRTNLPNGLGAVASDFGMTVNTYNYPDTMFLLAGVPCSAQSEPIKVNFAHMALAEAISSLAQFNDEDMLKIALRKLHHSHKVMSETLGGRIELIQQGVLASGPDDVKPWWFLDYETAFSDKAITVQSIREVATGFLNQNQLVTVNLLQNELPETRDFDKPTPVAFNQDGNSEVHLSTQDTAGLQSSAFVRDAMGVCLHQPMLPRSRCKAIFNHHVPAHGSSWAVREIVPHLFSERGVGRKRAAEQNIDIKWEKQFNDMVVTVTSDTADMEEAIDLYTTMLHKSTFNKDDVLSVVANVAAKTNSIVHNSKKMCEIAAMGSLCAKNSPLYEHTKEERMKSIKGISGRSLNEFIERMRSAPTQVGTINYSPSQRKNAISVACKNTSKPVPSEFNRSNRVPDGNVMFFKVPSSDSYTVNIAQPVHGVGGQDNKLLAELAVANRIMSNSFNGRLMRKLRTEKSLTYGASSFIASSGSDPVMMMSAAFSPEHVKEGISVSKELLNDFSEGNFTQEEFKMAKETAISLFNTFGTEMNYAEKRMKQMLSVDNPYDISLETDALLACTYEGVKKLIKGSLVADELKVVYSGPREMVL